MVAALVAALAVAAPGASAAKFYESSIGATSANPALGGTFASAPRDVAVNDPGIADGNAAADGDFYVVDDANHRIQRFNANGTFDLAWGADVATGGTTNFEICVSAATCKAGPGTAAPAAPTTNLLNGGLDNPQGVAVDQDTGNVYVSDRDNRRINQYNANGVFIRSFGFDVLATANEIQTVTVDASAGSFVLTFGAGGPGVGTTGDIAATATNATVAAALNALTNVSSGGGSVAVSGGPGAAGGGTYTITFNGGPLAASDVAQIAAASSGGDPLTGGTSTAASATSQNGSAAGTSYEVCAATQVCKIGVGANNLSPNSPGPNSGQFSTGSTTNGYRLDVSKPDGNPSTGKVYLANTGSLRIETYNLDGTTPSNFGTSAELGTGSSAALSVAVDAAGVAYVSMGNTTGAPVARYSTATGQFLTPISVSALTGNTTTRLGLEIDRVTGNLFVVSNAATAGLFEIGSPGGTPSLVGSYPTSFTATFTPIGLGVNPDTGKVFMPTSTNPAGTGTQVQRVVVFDGDGLGPIQLSLEPPTNVQATTADLHATINPAPNGPTGQPTSYRFEVSKDGLTWTQVTSNTPVPPNGDTTFAQPVQAQGTNLEPNTTYRVRVIATRASNTGAITSPELAFVTDPAPPVVTTDGPSLVSDTTARLNGRVNPGGLATSYWFEWGDDSYGHQTPVPAASAGAGGVAKAVGETIDGLAIDTLYHYRLCAQNPLVPIASPICGADRTFTTRTAAATPVGRSYEMVTDPDKPMRQGGEGKGDAFRPDFALAQAALPSTDGESLRWTMFPSATSGDAGHGSTWVYTPEIYSRGGTGWKAKAVTNIAPIAGAQGATLGPAGTSTDFEVSAWYTNARLFDNRSAMGVRNMGDTGGPRNAGWYPWLDPAWVAPSSIEEGVVWLSWIDDDGERLVGYSNDAQSFRDVTPADGGVAAQALVPPQGSGRALFLSGPEVDWRPRDLVNECTGTTADGDQTLIPARIAGVPFDTIGARDCEQGSPTDVRGGMLSGQGNLDSTEITTMSDSGDRVFFVSPDVASSVSPAVARCLAATGAATACPPQLFVRQYDDSGEATVRWISRAEDALFNAPQAIGLNGDGVAFEGASRDGSVVYFRTNAPLTVDDPNGGAQLPGGYTTGVASPNSWDLYRYELGADNDQDPAAGDPGDRLTRISGGPDGAADPNTNCKIVATSGPETGNCWGAASSNPADPFVPNGEGGAVRFMSDGGDRVYFVAAAQIPGATNAPPAGGVTSPTAAGARINTASRNLYLYDAGKTGAAAYEFVAQIPFNAGGPSGSVDSCSSFSTENGGPAFQVTPAGAQRQLSNFNCVHGTSSGDAVVFMTTGQLTADDVDQAADVYLYEAGSDRLTRVSAPPAGATPYTCLQPNGPGSPVLGRCNGDFGSKNEASGLAESVGLGGLRHWGVAEHADGTLKAVYFQSRIAMTPDDVNGPGAVAETGGEGVMDIFEWRDGKLRLISPGDSQDSAFFSGNARDGDHVFFWTEQRISAWEIDAADGDMYNATTADPIPDPPPPAPICAVLAGACQGGGTDSAPADLRTSSSGASGNNSAGDRKTLAVAGLSAKARRRATRAGSFVVSVRSNAAGTVKAVASARIGKRARRVGRGSVQMQVAGKAGLRVRLDRTARQRLSDGKALRLTVRVSSPGARGRSLTVLLPGASS